MLFALPKAIFVAVEVERLLSIVKVTAFPSTSVTTSVRVLAWPEVLLNAVMTAVALLDKGGQVALKSVCYCVLCTCIISFNSHYSKVPLMSASGYLSSIHTLSGDISILPSADSCASKSKVVLE